MRKSQVVLSNPIVAGIHSQLFRCNQVSLPTIKACQHQQQRSHHHPLRQSALRRHGFRLEVNFHLLKSTPSSFCFQLPSSKDHHRPLPRSRSCPLHSKRYHRTVTSRTNCNAPWRSAYRRWASLSDINAIMRLWRCTFVFIRPHGTFLRSCKVP